MTVTVSVTASICGSATSTCASNPARTSTSPLRYGGSPGARTSMCCRPTRMLTILKVPSAADVAQRPVSFDADGDAGRRACRPRQTRRRQSSRSRWCPGPGKRARTREPRRSTKAHRAGIHAYLSCNTRGPPGIPREPGMLHSAGFARRAGVSRRVAVPLRSNSMVLCLFTLLLVMGVQAPPQPPPALHPGAQRPDRRRRRASCSTRPPTPRRRSPRPWRPPPSDGIRVLVVWGSNDDERSANWPKVQRAPEISGAAVLLGRIQGGLRRRRAAPTGTWRSPTATA